MTRLFIAATTAIALTVTILAIPSDAPPLQSAPTASDAGHVAFEPAERPLAATAARHTAALPTLSPYPERQWRPGSRFVYSVRTTSSVAVDAEAAQLQRGLSGRLELVVADNDDALTHAVGRFEGRDWQRPADGVSSTGLDQPFIVTFDERGRFEALHVMTGTSSRARSLLAGALATLQVSGPTNDGAIGWEIVEHDTTGDYDAHYLRTDDWSLTRTKRGYVRVVTKDGLRPADDVGRYVVDAKASIDLGDDGWPMQLTTTERTDVALGQSNVRFTAAAEIRRLEADHVDVPGIDWAAFITGEVTTASDRAATARNRDRGLVGDASFDELHADIAALAKAAVQGEQPHFGRAVARIAALVRLHPESAVRVAEAARTAGTPYEAMSMTGALGMAGTAEAQLELTDLMIDAELVDTTRSGATIALATTRNVTAETLESLQAVPSDDPMSDSATLALGGAVKNVEQGVDTADAVQSLIDGYVEATTTEERILYLKALGNTGDVRAMESIVHALTDLDLTVRVVALGALRFIPGSDVDRLLAAHLKSSDESIRVAAMQSVSFRPITVAYWAPTLIEQLANDASEPVRKACVQLLAKLVSDAAVADALLLAAEGDPSAAVRQAATSALDAVRGA